MRHIFKTLQRDSILKQTSILARMPLFGVAFLLPVYGFAAGACDDASCASDLDILLQAEDQSVGKKAAGKSGISISVDGETIVGKPRTEDIARKTDVDLESVDIQVKFDGLDIDRQLAVSTVPNRRRLPFGEPVNFSASWNYPDWITKAEVRIYPRGEVSQNPTFNTPVEIVPLDAEGKAIWQPPLSENGDARDYVYSVRVYDDGSRFDESAPEILTIGGSGAGQDILFANREDEEPRGIIESHHGNDNPAYGKSNLAVANIPLHGGSVTVYGKNIPEGVSVNVLGRNVPVAASNDFVTQTILPPGDHLVDVQIHADSTGRSVEFEREVLIPDNEWFYVGIADLTVGKRFGSESNLLAPARAGEYDRVYKKGRLAFYLKGKMKGRYIITAAMDTTEENLDEIFSNLDKKDPRQLLRRLDPDDYYPVYGDDSELVEDAPTSGRFYVRIDKGQSHVMWGNFKTRIDGVELARYERALYGANAELKSETVTSFGEPVAQVKAFGAQPGTLPQRDEFLGTGGSVYFLRRQDINQGSEQISVEIRDGTTGLVVDRKTLKEGVDYTIDYVQGIIILRTPLSATVTGSGAVLPSSLASYEQFLVATYEYTPTLDDVDGFSFGGRAEAWLADQFRVGVTGYREDTGAADQTLYGADFTWRFSKKSYFQFEWARSEGDTFAYVTSRDGGFIFRPVTGDGVDGPAEAWRARVQLDVGEMTGGAMQGSVGVGYEEREAGFNAPGRYTPVDEEIWDVHAIIKPNSTTELSARVDKVLRADGVRKIEATGEVKQRLSEAFSVQIGVQYSDVSSQATNNSDGTGSRTDVGARLTWHGRDDEEVYIFGQTTVDRDATRDRNDRVGVGVKKHLTEEITAEVEVSYGTSGIGVFGGLAYEPNRTDRYYVGYRLAPDVAGGELKSYDPFDRDNGAVVVGMRRAISENTNAWTEHNFDMMGKTQGLTQAYGIDYQPTDTWKFSLGLEAGNIRDEVDGDFERYAPSAAVFYNEDGKSFRGRLEARFENSEDNKRDRTTWLAEADLGLRYNDNWRFLANIDLVVSDSDQSAVLDADYIEASIGWAYRPVDNDRLNALFKYTYLHDLPGPQQVNADNLLLGPKQRSHVLSADFIYDLTPKLSVGAKYGFRIGEVSTSRLEDDFVKSSAHLGILRADYHIVKNWDIFGEVRALWLSELEQVEYGALVGVYRHIGDNLKVGVGYNFGRFSDDLTDLTLDDEGVFVNVVGKF